MFKSIDRATKRPTCHDFSNSSAVHLWRLAVGLRLLVRATDASRFVARRYTFALSMFDEETLRSALPAANESDVTPGALELEMNSWARITNLWTHLQRRLWTHLHLRLNRLFFFYSSSCSIATCISQTAVHAQLRSEAAKMLKYDRVQRVVLPWYNGCIPLYSGFAPRNEEGPKAKIFLYADSCSSLCGFRQWSSLRALCVHIIVPVIWRAFTNRDSTYLGYAQWA